MSGATAMAGLCLSFFYLFVCNSSWANSEALYNFGVLSPVAISSLGIGQEGRERVNETEEDFGYTG